MRKLIFFNNKGFVKAFCAQEDAKVVFKDHFMEHYQDYVDCIVVCYGISDWEPLKLCQEHKINFIYMDNGYFGRLNSFFTARKCKKNFYRVVANATCLRTIIPRPDDRLKQQLKLIEDLYGVSNLIEEYKYDGKDIIIVPPSGKVLEICKLDVKQWIDSAIAIISANCDNKIIVRERAWLKDERFKAAPIHQLFVNGYATITFNSVAAIESLMFGVPSFLYNPNNNTEIYSSAEPVSIRDLTKIQERLFPADRYEWLSHLAYGQFSRVEIGDGTALKMILEQI